MTNQSTGLRCPACGYDLTALTSPTCPFAIARPGAEVAREPVRSEAPVSPTKGVLKVFFGMLLGVGSVDPRQPVWVVFAGLLAWAAVIVLIVWMASR